MSELKVVSAPSNQPILTGAVSQPAGTPTSTIARATPARLPVKLPVINKLTNVQPSLSTAPPPQQPGIYVPPKPPAAPQLDKIASDIGVARGRGADDTTILYSLVQKNPALTQDVKVAIQERKATPSQVLDTIVSKYSPKPAPTGFVGKVSADLKKRFQNVKDSAIATNEGKQSGGEYLLQGVGQAAGAVNDVIGETLSAVIPGFVKKGAGKVVKKIAEQPVNPFVVLNDAASAYSQAKEAHPRIARNVEAVANIASLIPIGKTAKVAEEAAVQAGEVAAKTTGKTVGGLTKFGVSQATGLSPETITQLIKNPKAITAAEKAGLDRISLASRVKNGIETRLETLSETGKAYDTIRKSGGVVSVPKGTVESVLGKYGLSLKNGKLITTAESVPLSQGDKVAIEGFVKQYGTQETLSGNGYLNARKALSNMSAYDATKTDISTTISRELRRTYDELGKSQLSGLEVLDNKYAPEVKLLKQIKRDYLNADGTLKDGAINKIANLTGKGKDQVLARLEKVVPNIKEDINILKALEDIEITKGQKVGAYLRGASGGFLLSGGNPVAAVISAIVASPQIAVPILKAYGAATRASKEFIGRIISKIRQGIKPAAEEARVISQAIDDYVKESLKNPSIGLSIKQVKKPLSPSEIYNPLADTGNAYYNRLNKYEAEALKAAQAKAKAARLPKLKAK